MEKESLRREEEFCNVKVSRVSLGDDTCDVQMDDMLENLTSFMYFGNDKADKKLKRQNSKVRKLITTKALVRDKYLCDK